MRRVAAEVRRPIVAALGRCCRSDVERAGEALQDAARPRIHTFIATSELHLTRKLRMTREACLDAAVDAVRLARRYTDDVQFSAEDATRTDLEFLCRVIEAVIDAGAATINLPDTVGYSTPDEVFEFFTTIRTRVPNVERAVLSTHCHDDLGLAAANSLAAIRAGARRKECTINGIGERAGNASLEEIVMATRVRSDRLPFQTDVDTRLIYTASQLLTSITGEAVQANKAIVGRNAFAHEAGIHQDGMLKDRRTYEIMRPEEVGRARRSCSASIPAGTPCRSGARSWAARSAGSRSIVYRRLMALADAQKQITDGDLRRIVQEARAEALAAQSGVEALAAHGYGHGV